MASITLSEAQFDALRTAFTTLAEAFGTDGAPVTNGSTRRRTKSAPAEDTAPAEDVDIEETDETRRIADILDSDRGRELDAMSLPRLRKMAIELGYEEEGVNGSDKSGLVVAIVQAETEVEGEADGDADDDADADEEVSEADEVPSYEELDAMGIRALRKFVVDTWGDVSDEIDVAKASKQDILDWVFPADDAAAEDDEDEDESDEDEGDEEGLTVEELNAMSIADLRKVAKEYGGTPKAGAKKPELIRLINDLADVQY